MTLTHEYYVTDMAWNYDRERIPEANSINGVLFMFPQTGRMEHPKAGSGETQLTLTLRTL